MSYDFDTLFRAYLNDPMVQSLGYTTVKDFYIQIDGACQDAWDDGRDPYPQDLCLLDYMNSCIEQDSNWFETYAS